jgi:putative flippase GtrA
MSWLFDERESTCARKSRGKRKDLGLQPCGDCTTKRPSYLKKIRMPNPKQFAAYLGTGLLTTAFDATVTFCLYEFVGLSAFTSSAIGFLSGFFIHFPLNRNKVFFSQQGQRFKIKTQILLYVFLSVFNLISTSLAVALLVHLGLQIVISKFLVAGVFVIWNFAVFKFFIFRSVKK